MAISEMKMQMVIANCFKNECDTNTSIRQAFEKGFRIGVEKAMNRPQGKWIKTNNIWTDGYCGERIFPYHCSCCGYKTWDDELTNFCPSCGAKMNENYKESK